MSESESDVSTSDSDQDSGEERPAKIPRVETAGNGEQDQDGDSGSGTEDDLDDDDDVSNDEYEEQEDHKRTSKRPGHDMILDMAEVSDGDDDYETDGEDGIQALLPTTDKGMGKSRARSVEADPSGHMKFMQQINELDGDKIVEAMAKRFSGYNAGSYVMQDDEHSYEIQQQRLLPGIKDPNLWMVKCRIGFEKETAFNLMRKFVFLHDSKPLLIKSVIAPEAVKGYIYVEAYKQSHVKQAIDGNSNLNIGQHNQKMVPIQEMTDVLKVVRDPTVVKKGSWVRLKKGIYRDDIAQVVYVDNSQNTLYLKLIPRLDLKKIAAKYDSKNNNRPLPRNKQFKRPPAKLFDDEAIEECGGTVSNERGFQLFEGDNYQSGFLCKYFPKSAILMDGVTPTLKELEKFQTNPEDIDVNLNNSARDIKLIPGDFVEVCEGELKNLLGKVTSVDGSNVNIISKHEELQTVMEFPIRELRKYFQIGDHVKVVGGQFMGESGLVVRVEENVAIIFSDISRDEMKVRPRDLQLCTETSSGIDSQGQNEVGDLVQVDPQTVGIIVRIERDSYRVLTHYDKIQSVKQQAVQKKNSRRAVTLDKNNNSLSVKDLVRIMDGKKKGSQGEIQHIFRNFVFVKIHQYFENAGYAVVRSKACELVGGQNKPAGIIGTPRASPRPNNTLQSPRVVMSSPRGAGGYGRGGGNFARDTKLVGQTVRITVGAYKNHIGIVKDATEALARVELHTSPLTINVDKTHLAIVSDQKTGSQTVAHTPNLGYQTPMHGRWGGATPMHGSRTPMYGSMTPDPGSRTPHYGSETPLHDPSRTPSAWDPSIATPRHEFSYPFDTPMTPVGHLSEASPYPSHYGANQTPLYGTEPISPSHFDSVTPTPGQSVTPGVTASRDISFLPPETLKGLEVQISHPGGSLNGKTGVILHATLMNKATVKLHHLRETGRDTVDLQLRDLELTQVSEGDQIKLLRDQDNSVYKLLQIDSDDAVLRGQSGDLRMVPLDKVAKYTSVIS
ncbi:hypothetical protein LOD99_2774 [Oopsacas minuta]|uniref:Transcription elongation factor SPT5 n=1 Tax=Oopsacas minuta TaxID=111878 RepID=A0AAV7K2W6_9METZ|nr:hypothetical protein LOD99_2774 [Oopsacas minuta]